MPNWSRRRGHQQAYLAGILDGEGSFGIYRAGGTYQGRVTLAMQNPEAVMILYALYPEGKFSRVGPEYRVVYNQFHCYQLTDELIPFLVGKHEQAKVLLSFLAHRRRDHQVKAPNGKGDCERCDYLCSTIATLKREVKGVNSVNALLEHGLREYRAKREDVEADVAAMRQMLESLEGVETRDRESTPIEPTSAPEQKIVH